MIVGITRRRTFDRLRREGTRVRGATLTLTYLADDHLPGVGARPAVAFSVPRKVGGAVVRNRCRRRVRAVLDQRARQGTLRNGAYLVHIKAPLAGLDPAALGAEIDELLRGLTTRRRG